jgi:predicted nucleic acid-binding Zn ribbon protein
MLSSEQARRAVACRRLVKRACALCGLAAVGTTKRKYCSSRCRDAAYRQRRHARRTVAALAPTPGAVEALVAELLVTDPELVVRQCAAHIARQAVRPVYRDHCPTCLAEFAATARQQYCSRHCQNVAAARRRKARERVGVPTADQLMRGYLARYAPKRRGRRAGGIP